MLLHTGIYYCIPILLYHTRLNIYINCIVACCTMEIPNILLYYTVHVTLSHLDVPYAIFY